MSRFLRLAFVASTAAAALSSNAAPAHAAPAPSGCDMQFFAVGGARSTNAPGSVNTHQLELVCVPFTNIVYPVNAITVLGAGGAHLLALHRTVSAAHLLHARSHGAHPGAHPIGPAHGCSRPLQIGK